MKTVTRRKFLAAAVATATISPNVFAAEKSRPLFDGKSLDGWHKPVKRIGHGTGGRRLVEKDGVLTGEQDPPGSGNGGKHSVA